MSKSNIRILIVEDERITAEDLSISMKNLGYDIVGTVATGEDAIATARKTQPDLVLMDIILKGKMNGIEATMRIQTEQDIPVIYLTAFSDENTIERLKESKPFGYLQKPFDDKELAGVIETALEKFRILKELRESREWFSVTLQSLGDAVICTSMDGRISFINPAAEKLTGWSEEQALSRPFGEVFRIVTEGNDRPIEDPVTQVLKLGRIMKLTDKTLLIAKDGRKIPIDDSAAPIRNARGETIGVVLVFKDVTERRIAETAIRQSEEKYRLLVDHVNEAIFVAQDGIIRYANPMTASLFGYTLEELDSKDMTVLIHPEDRERIMKQHDLKMRGIKTQGKDNCRIVTKTGEARWVEFGYVRIEWQGRPATLNFLSDITERKLAELASQKAEEALRVSEEKYRTLVRYSSDPIFSFNPDETYHYVNDAFAKPFGKKPEEIIGKSPHDIFTRDEAEKRLTAVRKVFKTGVKEDIEVKVVTKDGEIQHYLTVVDPIKDKQGRVVTVSCSSKNITERKRAEEALRESESVQRNLAEKLTALTGVTNDLSVSSTFDDLCHDAVVFGRERLGFDRLGFWFNDDADEYIVGSFGTRENGEIRDERQKRMAITQGHLDTVEKARSSPVFFENIELFNDEAETIGRGDLGIANLWNGERVIGNLYVDNLVQKKPFTETDRKVLGLYATMLGHLCTLKKTEERLRQSESAQRSLADHLVTLMDTTNDLSLSRSFDDLCRNAVEFGRERFGFDRLSVWFISDDGNHLSGSFGTDEKGRTRDERDGRIPIKDDHMTAVWRGRVPLQLFDDQNLYDGSNNIIGRGAMAIVNLWDGKRVIGNLCADNLFNHRPFTEIDQKILNLYATVLGHLCTLKRTETRNLHLNEVLKAIRDVNQLITHERDAERLLQGACDILHRSRNYAFALISVFEPESKRVRFNAWTGLDIAFAKGSAIHKKDIPSHDGPTGEMLRTGKTVVCRNAANDPLVKNWRQAIIEKGVQTVIATPILRNGLITGTMVIASERQEAFDSDEMDLLEEMASDIGFALESIDLENERRLAEENVRRNEERYRTLVESIIDYTYHVDVRDGAVVSTLHGPGCTAVTGYTPDEYMADPLLWIGMTLEADKATVIGQAESIVAGKPVSPIEHRIVHKDGSIHWVRNTPVPRYDADGRLMSYDGVVVDITERKRAEEALWESEKRFSTVFKQSPFGIGIIDLDDGRILDINPSMTDILGYHPDETIGRTVESLNIWIDLDQRKRFLNSLKEQGSLKNFDVPFRMKSGKIGTLTISAETIELNGKPYLLTVINDITDRRRMEKALRESETKFRSIVETSQEWIWAMDTAGLHTYCNPAVEKILGYSPDEFIGRDAISLLHEDDKHVVKGMLADAVAQKKGWTNLVLRWKHKNGSYRFLESNSISMLNLQGELTGFWGADRDITGRIHAEEALRASERKFRTFIEQSTEGLTLIDEEGRVIEWNYALDQLTGMSRNEVLGLNYWDLQDRVTPPELQSLERYRKFKTIQKKILKTGRLPDIEQPFEATIIRSDGETRHIQQTVFTIKTDEGFRIGSITRDVTERKQVEKALRENEEKFRIAFDNAPTGMSIIQSNGHYTEVNPHLCDMFGYTREELLSGTIYQITHPDDVERSHLWIKKKIAGDDSEPEIEKRYIHKDGHIVWGVVRSQWIRNADGSPMMAIAHIHDITDRKRMEEALRESEEKFRQIVEKSNDVFYYQDFNSGRFEYVSPKVIDVLGDDPEAFLNIGIEEQFERFHPEDLPRLVNFKYELLEADAKGEKHFAREFRLRNKRGEYRWIHGNYSLVYDENGEPRSIVGSLADVTERKLAEETLLKRNQELERFNRLTVGRELKMAELKKEIASLRQRIGGKKKPKAKS